MISPITAGITFGLSAGLTPGPLLTFVITQTLRHGPREGIKVAAVPLITDLPIIALCLLVLSRVAGLDPLLGTLSLAGGLFVFYLAWDSFRTTPLEISADRRTAGSIKKGILINALNPHPYLFWVTVGGPIIVGARQEALSAAVAFVLFFYLLLVGAKVILALMVARSRNFLSSRGYLWSMRALGGLLTLFGFLLLKEGYRLVFGG
jgi:threonine/homoserine/homoserine lactone efflux protein